MRRRLALVALAGAAAGCSALIGLGDYSADGEASDGGVSDAPIAPLEDVVTIDVPVIPAPPGCGDGKSDPGEECDDGNREPYDGCSPFCKRELLCNTSCPANCGDGFRVGKEACDDGNLVDGDGCSKTCEVEKGFTCADTELAPPSADLVLPVIYRDMRYRNTPNGHPDFQRSIATVRGLVNDELDVVAPVGRPTLKKENTAVTSTSENFCWWYHDQGCVDGGANPFARRVTSDQAGNPTALVFQASGTDAVSYSNSKFFPINGLGWDSELGGQYLDAGGCTPERNYSFTTELHYPFQYAGGEKIDFKGDDDVWIFINGRLVIDLGGVHGPDSESLTLAGLGLLKGAAYDLAVFHAERYVCESNFIMTLTKFHRTVSKCTK